MKRRKWWIAALVLLVLAIFGISLFANNRDDAYLTRFHPHVEPWDAPAVGVMPMPYRGTLYIFRKEDAADVLQSIEKKFKSETGYRRLDNSDGEGKTVSYTYPVGKDEYGIGYSNTKTMLQFMLREPTRKKVPPGGCIVVIIRPPNWLERQLDAVKKALHWE